MSKRFTDTDIWKKKWFRCLTPQLKCAVQYLFAQCDAAGVWDADYELMSYYIGQDVTQTDIVAIDGGKQFETLPGGKIWVTGFIEFQYGVLSENCKPHIPAIKSLKKHNLYKGYTKGIHTLEEKDKDKEEEKEKEIQGVQGDFEDVPEVNQVREELQTFFGVTEQTMPQQFMQIGHFATCIHHRNKTHKTLEHFWKQHNGYKEYLSRQPDFRGYGLEKYLGTGPDFFMNGGWNKENWQQKVDKLKKTTEGKNATYIAPKKLLK